jgi:hypothetical protein
MKLTPLHSDEPTKPGRKVRHTSRSQSETEVPNFHKSDEPLLVEVRGFEPLTPCMPSMRVQLSIVHRCPNLMRSVQFDSIQADD